VKTAASAPSLSRERERERGLEAEEALSLTHTPSPQSIAMTPFLGESSVCSLPSSCGPQADSIMSSLDLSTVLGDPYSPPVKKCEVEPCPAVDIAPVLLTFSDLLSKSAQEEEPMADNASEFSVSLDPFSVLDINLDDEEDLEEMEPTTADKIKDVTLNVLILLAFTLFAVFAASAVPAPILIFVEGTIFMHPKS
jgi:hypothetical protein